MPNYVPIQDLPILTDLSDTDYIPVSDGETASAIQVGNFKAYDVDPTLTESGHASDAKATGDKIGELKSAIRYNIIDSMALVKSIVSGWKLKSDGYSEADNEYVMRKYYVNAKDAIYIESTNSDVRMQFQTAASVPASGAQFVVGDKITDGYTGILIVPDTATHLIVSELQSDAASNVYVTNLKATNTKINNIDGLFASFMANDIYNIQANYEQGTWDDTKQGAAVNSNTRIRCNDFLYTPTNDINVVSNTDSLYWFVLEFDENLQYVKHSDSPNGGWLAPTVKTYKANNPFIKIVLRKNNNAAITPNDAVGFKISPITKYNGIDILQFDPDVIVSGWRLTGDGLCASSTDGAKLHKYNVIGVNEITLISNAVYQFQSSANVPAEGANQWLIGDAVTGQTYGKIIVPAGATYLIISIENGDSNSGVYNKGTNTSSNVNNYTITPNPMLFTERFIGHKGGGKTAPENTIPCLQQGYDNGFKIFEFDIQFTSDDVPVLLHDTTINNVARNSDGTEISETINIGDITYAQALNYDFGIKEGSTYAGTKIARLIDALLWLKKHTCCAEIDISGTQDLTADRCTILYNTVRNKGMLGASVFTAGSAKLSLLANAGKDICVCVSTIGTSEEAAAAAAANKTISMFTMCSVQYPYLTAEQVDYAHKYGMLVKAFTITDTTGYNTASNYGCDMFILDNLYPNQLA